MALADDSGLEVDSLDGKPGVWSARFAGESASDAENNRKLLRCMADVPPGERKAQFRCVIALVSPKGAERLVEGICSGVIIEEERGSGGFGYDPLFWCPTLVRPLLSCRQRRRTGSVIGERHCSRYCRLSGNGWSMV